MTSMSIDFKKMAIAFRKQVLEKALKAGSTIVYMKNGELVEEDPKNVGQLKKFEVVK